MAYRSYAIDYLGKEEGYGLIERVEDREYQTLVTDHSVSTILKHVARHLEDTDDIYIPELVAEVLDIESSYKYNQIMSAMNDEMDASEQTQGILNALFNSLFKDISESTNRPGGEVMGADELKETQMPKRPEPLHDLEADVDQEIQREYYQRFQEWKQQQQRLEEEHNDND